MNPKHVGHGVHFIHFKTDCRDDRNGSETNFGKIIVASSVNPVRYQFTDGENGFKLPISSTITPCILQCLWNAHNFSRNINVLQRLCHKWDYTVHHFCLERCGKTLPRSLKAVESRRKPSQLSCHSVRFHRQSVQSFQSQHPKGLKMQSFFLSVSQKLLITVFPSEIKSKKRRQAERGGDKNRED